MAKRSGLPWWAWAPFLPVLLSILLVWRLRRQKKHVPAARRVDSIPLPPDPAPRAARPEAAPRASADDLTVLKGVGPKTADVLRGNGITTFAQLADTPVARLEEMLHAAGMRIVNPATWPAQAAQQMLDTLER